MSANASRPAGIRRASSRAIPSELYQQIWAVVGRIPRGRVATYGQIAALSGRPGQPRLVGYALHRIPDGSKLPWHRVINARGEVSPRAGGSASSGERLQRALLTREGIRFDSRGRLDLDRYRWRSRVGPVASKPMLKARQTTFKKVVKK